MVDNIPYTLEDLLPHAHPMILLDRIMAYQDDFIHVGVTIKKESLFFEKGEVPGYVALEYMAQAIGVWNGLMARQQHKKPQIGFLLGSRQLKLYSFSFKECEELDIYGRVQYNDGEMAAFECWVEIQGIRAAEANLNVFQPKSTLLEKGIL